MINLRVACCGWARGRATLEKVRPAFNDYQAGTQVGRSGRYVHGCAVTAQVTMGCQAGWLLACWRGCN